MRPFFSGGASTAFAEGAAAHVDRPPSISDAHEGTFRRSPSGRQLLEHDVARPVGQRLREHHESPPPGERDGRLHYADRARIAVYDEAGTAPRIEEVGPSAASEFISLVASRTYELSRSLGGRVPYSVINELVENYVHADFRGPVVSILDAGNTIRFSDQGPGIKDKEKAVEPGYTTASVDMKRYIRGVGSGLPLVRDSLSLNDGSLRIDDNLGSGTVVTVSVGTAAVGGASSSARTPRTVLPLPVSSHSKGLPSAATASEGPGPVLPDSRTTGDVGATVESFAFPPGGQTSPWAPGRHAPPSLDHGGPRLTNRQKRVLALVMEAGEAGPSLVAKELAIGLSTAYRDLAHLEMLEFIAADGTGKRSLTNEGAAFLHGLLHPEG